MHGPAELELVRVRWGFRSYGAWVLANAVGGAAGASVILLSGSVILLTGMYDTPLLMLALCVFGTILAVPQALVLRDYVRRPITWIWATGLVWTGVTLLFFGPLPALLPESIPHPFDPRTSFDRSAVVFVFLPAAGVMVGAVQAWLMALPWRPHGFARTRFGRGERRRAGVRLAHRSCPPSGARPQTKQQSSWRPSAHSIMNAPPADQTGPATYPLLYIVAKQ
jgi:hypothetical protein